MGVEADGEDVAGVHDIGDFDDADAGGGVVVDDGPVDGCGTAVFGEEGGVEVDAAVGGDGEECVGEFLAEGDDDEACGLEGMEEGEGVGGVGVFGGAGEGEVVIDGPLGDGGWGENFAAAGGAVGLGDDVEDFVAGGGEGVEGGDGEGAGAEEDDVHGGSVNAIALWGNARAGG